MGINSLEKIADNSDPRHIEALNIMSSGKVEKHAYAYFAKHYHPIAKIFQQLLAALISKSDNEEVRIILVENLYEECGNLDISKSHVELFSRFVRSLGLSDKDTVTSEDQSSVLYLENLKHICFNEPIHKGLAVLYIFEKTFCHICKMISDGLRKQRLVTDDNLEFFDIHAVVDVKHSEQLMQALSMECVDDESWGEAVEAAAENASLMHAFYNSIPVVDACYT